MMLASAEVNAQDKAEQLRGIERARLRALVDADIPTASRLHADDFELIDPRGGTHSKEQYLRSIASGDLNYLEWEPGEIRVRQYGKSAVLPLSSALESFHQGERRTCSYFLAHGLLRKAEGAMASCLGTCHPAK
jgi:hypothetical protein